jgi:hypothetical protein
MTGMRHLQELRLALAEWGGAVVTVPFVDGRSTTRILDRLIGSETLVVEHSDVV